MYICNECGEVFEEPKIVEEYHPYGMGYATEKWAVCPYCKENDFKEAEECSCCGKYAPDLIEGLCEKCFWE